MLRLGLKVLKLLLLICSGVVWVKLVGLVRVVVSRVRVVVWGVFIVMVFNGLR